MESRQCLAATSRVFLIIGAILAGMATSGRAQTNHLIYSDSLQNSWNNWSWGSTINFSQSSPVHGGSKSMSVTLSAAWGALYLEHADMNGGAFAALSLWLNGGSSGGQLLKISGLANHNEQAYTNLSALAKNAWTQFVIPLSALGVSSSAAFDGIWIADRSGGTQSIFYVDDLMLAAGTNPVVSLTSPLDGAILAGPASVGFSASVISNGHSIIKIQFYSGSTLLSEDTSPPYAYTWSGVPAGSYSVFARAVYDTDKTVDSATASVTVAGVTPVTVSVNVLSNRHPIHPNIYGVAFASANQLAELNAPLNRSGGNSETRYNWQLNAHNHGADWYFESIAEDDATPGGAADSFVSDSHAGGAEPMLTVPMIGWAPILGANRGKLSSYSIAKYGPQTDADYSWMPDAGNGKSSTNGGAAITWNDRTDANVAVDSSFQRSWLQHLTNTWGNSAHGGVNYYFTDNEHSIWQGTHQDVHPVGPPMAEIRDKMIEYAGMIRTVDSNVTILGPEEWGWSGYLYSGYDQWYGAKYGWGGTLPDRTTNGGSDYMPWLLTQLYKQSTNTHQRLLDYFTLHFYPQSGEYGDDTSSAMQLTRNRSTRSLWDTNYVDESWIGEVVRLIPRMRAWANACYPGVKIGITEYNWGAEAHMNGATAQADVFGIFGREGLDLAIRWMTPETNTFAFAAMKFFRNYDGQKSTFGDTSVSATVPNSDTVAAYAAVRTNDGALTVIVVNKQLDAQAGLSLLLTNQSFSGKAQVWQLTSATNAIVRLADLPVTNNLLSTTLPLQSVTLFVLPAATSVVQPTLRTPVQSADGTFGFWADVTSSQRYVIQASSNLSTWTPVLTNIPTSNSWHVMLPVTSSGKTFYRAVWGQ
jgi:hypothetical protein